MSERVYARQFHAEPGAEAWRVLPDGATAFFRSGSFAESLRFVAAVGGIVEGGPVPDIDIRGDGVTVLLRAFKPEGYGMTTVELALARRIGSAAAELGLLPDPAAIQGLSVIPGAKDRATIMPFWQAVLGYVPRQDNPGEDMVDPHDRTAPFWFEQMDELRPDGKGSIHLVVWLPWDQAQARIAAGLAAGGTVIRENTEELFWTLADPVGNELDIATTPAPDAGSA